MASEQILGKRVTAHDLRAFFHGDLGAAHYFARAAEWAGFPAGATVARQFHQAEAVYCLIEGTIAFSVEDTSSGAPIAVGETALPFTPAGWSGLRPRGRYATTVETRTAARFIRWKTPDLWRLLYSNPTRAVSFVECLVESGLQLLYDIRKGIRAFAGGAPVAWALTGTPDVAETGVRAGTVFPAPIEETAAVIENSAFFREFTDQERVAFCRAARHVRVRGGDHILIEGGTTDGLYILARGRVSMRFRGADGHGVVTRSISREGTVLCWFGVNRPLPSPFTVTATRDTELVYIPGSSIARRAAENPEFGFVYAQRVLWLLSQYFFSARTRLISESAENEALAVASLLAHRAMELSQRSELHKIPHLLAHPTTRQDAFDTLHRLVTAGGPLERNMAELQLDILIDLERETRFREKLVYVYERIAGADPAATRSALLQDSAQGLQHAFEEVPYVIAGMENLPAEGGFLAIYNHLACNKQYQLPNNFEFTLDSHFVSSILLRTFGTPGLRIVKESDSEEFWHRGYYGRILTIKVSDGQSAAERTRFYRTVENTLISGTPVVMAPEGTNDTAESWTETSPGTFQPGAFVLPTRMAAEPWIVPIALANFDKAVKNNVFAAVIKPPFRMSDRVADAGDRQAMDDFIRGYQDEFRRYVAEARALAEEVREGGALGLGMVSNLTRLNRLDSEFADDVHQLERRVREADAPEHSVVFYGSSSLRQWDGIGRDLGLANALNLGFGGSTLAACVHFFERLVVPHAPSALFVYAGDNDIGNGAAAEEVVQDCRALLFKVDQYLSGVPLYLLSIKPSPFRAGQMDVIVRANKGIAELAAARPATHFIDIFPAMLRADGTPDPALYSDDMLHLNAEGYARWASVLRPAARALANAA